MTHRDFAQLLTHAFEARRELIAQLEREGTDCLRLFHGAVEGRPGVAIDRYGPLVLVQTWSVELEADAIVTIERVLREVLALELPVVWNRRESPWFDQTGPKGPERPLGREGGYIFDVRPRHRGRDPLLFLDLRAFRRYLGGVARDRSVLNLFSYTCGVGVYAERGGAKEVVNVDFAESALEIGRANHGRNRPRATATHDGTATDDSTATHDGTATHDSTAGHETAAGREPSVGPLAGDPRVVFLQYDVIPTLWRYAGLQVNLRGKRERPLPPLSARTFDVVFMDPPRWAKTPYGAIDVVRDYPTLLKPGLLTTAPGGLFAATHHVPEVDIETFEKTLRRTAEKCGRPIRSIERMGPEADFPSYDGRPPLKILLAELAP